MNQTRVRHPLFARLYTRVVGGMEKGGLAQRRGTLLAGLSGEVLEVGAGPGPSFAHYPEGVRRVSAVEPEPYLRKAAEAEAARVPTTVDVVDGVAERLPFAEGRFDAAVVALVLCSVADPSVALREIHRVLAPGAELRFLEHGRADTPGMRRAQRAIDATVGPFLSGGCHCGRDTVSEIEAAGFTVTRTERFLFPGSRSPHAFFALGAATRT